MAESTSKIQNYIDFVDQLDNISKMRDAIA
jgi:hypothetical protein